VLKQKCSPKWRAALFLNFYSVKYFFANLSILNRYKLSNVSTTSSFPFIAGFLGFHKTGQHIKKVAARSQTNHTRHNEQA
jgi:hypothetical protein